MSSQNIEAFKAELKALLGKHNAAICWGCDSYSDTAGIYDEYMYVYYNDDWKEFRLCSGSGIESNDL